MNEIIQRLAKELGIETRQAQSAAQLDEGNIAFIAHYQRSHRRLKR